MHINQWNVHCFVYWYNFISFYLKYFFQLKNTEITNSQNKYFPEKCSCHQSNVFPAWFQCHRLSTVIHRQWQESVKCCKQHAGGAWWNNCCKNESNWIYHEMLLRHGWPDSTETYFTTLKSMGTPLLTSATSHLKFAHERCVTSSEHEGTPP